MQNDAAIALTCMSALYSHPTLKDKVAVSTKRKHQVAGSAFSGSKAHTTQLKQSAISDLGLADSTDKTSCKKEFAIQWRKSVIAAAEH
jgi:hypothetical protein